MDIKEYNELSLKFSLLVTTWDCYNDTPIPDDEIMKDCKKCADIAIQHATIKCIEVLESLFPKLVDNKLPSNAMCFFDAEKLHSELKSLLNNPYNTPQ